MKFRRGLRVFLLLLLVFVTQAGCPGVEYPNCKTDAQCKVKSGDNVRAGVCVFGKCQECAADPDCSQGQQCKDNMCVQGCESDLDCDVSSYCGNGSCQLNCQDSSSCSAGEVCHKGQCIRKVTCNSSSGCDAGFECESGLCVQMTDVTPNMTCSAEGLVNFDFDKEALTSDAIAKLDGIASCARENGQFNFVIAGHTDDRGSNEYNMSLGERRAMSVSNYLQNMGVDEKRLRVVSYGEEKPIDPAQNEEAWAKNRRSVISVE